MNSAVAYLKRSTGRPPGESAMIAMALMKAEVPHNDPSVQACMNQVRTRFGTGGDLFTVDR